jgi:hypothetical protein
MPDRRQQVVLADDAITLPNQVNQEIENLGLDRHQVRSPPQLAAIRVERTILEQIAQNSIPLVTQRPRRTLAHALQRKNGGNAKPKSRGPEGRNAPFLT